VKVFIVIPAHNEEKRIGPVLAKVKKMGYEFIVVDDGSKDNTTLVAKKHTPYVISHKINLGKGAALKTGCEAALSLGAQGIVIMDADGQHSPQDLPKFIKGLREYHVVLGKRDFSKIPFIRRFGNKIISLVIKELFNIEAQDILCGFKAFSRKAYHKIAWNSLGYSVETEIVAMTGEYRLSNCEVSVATVYYDKFKGLTVLAGIEILLDIIKFKLLR
jgi:glycosyltransferase involved in cell wall biosynthesis